MRLPNAEDAIIDIRKIRDYCLDPDHPRGKHKARVFRSRLGLQKGDADALVEAIRSAARHEECNEGEIDAFGRRFVLDFALAIGDNTAMIRTVWIVRTDETMPRLVTCYVL